MYLVRLMYTFACVSLLLMCSIFADGGYPTTAQEAIDFGLQKLHEFYDEHSVSVTCSLDPEIRMNVTEVIQSKGYPCEDYSVVTQDGFILSVQRIPHGRNGQGQKVKGQRPVVFVQHGLLSSSYDWVNNLANESLGFILADAGYDVWLGNLRGNTYSDKHIHLKKSQAEFWSWSWDEMAQYDVPAMIDFVLEHTNQSQLYYVGHSQGTMVAFAGFSKFPEYAKKVKMMFALGPVAEVGHLKGPLRIFSYFTKEVEFLFDILGVHDFFPSSEILKILGATVCNAPTRIVCEDVIFVICGVDTSQLNETRLPVYISHTPAGTSVQNMVHFAQLVRSGAFQMFNFGSKLKNTEHYGQPSPPMYNVQDFQVPTVLFSGSHDWLADPKDVTWLESQLPQLVHSYKYPGWNHLDFVWGLNAATQVYANIIDYIQGSDTPEN